LFSKLFMTEFLPSYGQLSKSENLYVHQMETVDVMNRVINLKLIRGTSSLVSLFMKKCKVA